MNLRRIHLNFFSQIEDLAEAKHIKSRWETFWWGGKLIRTSPTALELSIRPMAGPWKLMLPPEAQLILAARWAFDRVWQECTSAKDVKFQLRSLQFLWLGESHGESWRLDWSVSVIHRESVLARARNGQQVIEEFVIPIYNQKSQQVAQVQLSAVFSDSLLLLKGSR